MKFSLVASTFASALEPLARLAKENKVIPCLENVCITQRGNLLDLRTSDQMVTLTTTLTVIVPPDSQLKNPHTMLVPARQLYQLLVSLEHNTLEFSSNGTQQFYVKGHEATYMIQGEGAEYFPSAPEVHVGQSAWQLPGKELWTAIQRVGFAASKDELRPAMCGIKFDFTDRGVLMLTATNGYQLVSRSVEYHPESQPSEEFVSVVVPYTAVQMLKSFASVDQVVVLRSETHLVFATPLLRLTVRLIDERYPDLDNALPKIEPAVSLNLLRPWLVGELHRLQLLAHASASVRLVVIQQEQPVVVFTFTDENSAVVRVRPLRITNAAQEGPDAERPPDAPEALPFCTCFSLRLLTQIIEHLDGEEVTMEFFSPYKPAVCYSPDRQPGEYSLLAPTADNRAD